MNPWRRKERYALLHIFAPKRAVARTRERRTHIDYAEVDPRLEIAVLVQIVLQGDINVIDKGPPGA